MCPAFTRSREHSSMVPPKVREHSSYSIKGLWEADRIVVMQSPCAVDALDPPLDRS